MNWPYLHLITNHFPIILLIVGTTAAAIGRLPGREGVLRYGAVCLLLGGLAAPVAYVTGLQAEESVEALWYAAEPAIEAHEELGLWALVAALLAGGTGAAWLRRGGLKLGWLVAATGVAATAVVTLTALRGGRIVHASEALEAGPPPASGAAAADYRGDRDDRGDGAEEAR